MRGSLKNKLGIQNNISKQTLLQANIIGGKSAKRPRRSGNCKRRCWKISMVSQPSLYLQAFVTLLYSSPKSLLNMTKQVQSKGHQKTCRNLNIQKTFLSTTTFLCGAAGGHISNGAMRAVIPQLRTAIAQA